MTQLTQLRYVNHLGTWNVRGINGIAKREEVVDVFREGKFELLALTEMKLKGNRGIIVWCKWHHCRCLGDGKS